MSGLWLKITLPNNPYQTCIDLFQILNIINKSYDGKSIASIEKIDPTHNVTITDPSTGHSSNLQAFLFPRIHDNYFIYDTCGYISNIELNNSNQYEIDIIIIYQIGNTTQINSYIIVLDINYFANNNTQSNVGAHGYKLEYISNNYGIFNDLVITNSLIYTTDQNTTYINTNNDYNIIPAPLSINANNDSKIYGQLKTYGSGSTAFISHGLQNNETINSITLAVSDNGGNINAPVGFYTLTPSEAFGSTFDINNYSPTYIIGVLTINSLTLTGNFTGTSKVYDGNTNVNPAFSFSPNNIVSGDIVNITNLNGTYNSQNVNANIITITGTISNSNYALPNTTTGTITSLTLTGNFTGTSKVYDGNTNVNPAFSFSPNNIVSGDIVNITNLNGTYNSQNVNANIITITGTISNSNYALPNTTTATITRVIITPSFTSIPKYYDRNTNAQVNYTLDGVLSGQTLTISYNANYLTPSVGTNKDIFINNINVNKNEYSLNYVLKFVLTAIFNGQILENNQNNIEQYINQYTSLKSIKKITVIQSERNKFATIYMNKFVFVAHLN